MAILHPNIPKRKKRKPTAKQRALQSSWDAIVKKYETKTVAAKPYKAPTPYRRETVEVPSLGTYEGDCTKPEQVMYTGGNMLGIATLHKSNAVPVFSEEDAVEISRMRRG